MKKLIASLLFVFAIATFSTKIIYAQSTVGTPIQGTSIGLDHDPGGGIANSKTDVNGKFSFKLGKLIVKEGNRYKLLISYEDIIQNAVKKDPAFATNKENYVVILEITGTSKDVTFNNRKAPVKMAIASNTGTLSVVDRLGDGFISGTLTYELRASKPK